MPCRAAALLAVITRDSLLKRIQCATMMQGLACASGGWAYGVAFADRPFDLSSFLVEFAIPGYVFHRQSSPVDENYAEADQRKAYHEG